MTRVHLLPRGEHIAPMPEPIKGTVGRRVPGGYCPRMASPKVYFQASRGDTRTRSPQWLEDQRALWGQGAPRNLYAR